MGLHPKYETPEELQAEISKYFAENKGKVTISGLAYALGFESRQSFYDYEKRDVFSYTVKRARLFIENEYEDLLRSGNVTGAIFALKNFGWSDKQEIDHTTKGQLIGIDYSKLSDAAIREILAAGRSSGTEE